MMLKRGIILAHGNWQERSAGSGGGGGGLCASIQDCYPDVIHHDMTVTRFLPRPI